MKFCILRKLSKIKRSPKEKNRTVAGSELVRSLNHAMFYVKDAAKSKNCIFECHAHVLDGQMIQAVNLVTKKALFFGSADSFLQPSDIVFSPGGSGEYLAVARHNLGGQIHIQNFATREKVFLPKNVLFEATGIRNLSDKANQCLPLIEKVQVGGSTSITIHVYDMEKGARISIHEKIIDEKEDHAVCLKIQEGYIILSQYEIESRKIENLFLINIKNGKTFDIKNQGVLDDFTDPDLSGFFVHGNFLLTRADKQIHILDMENGSPSFSIDYSWERWGVKDGYLFMTQHKSIDIWEIETKKQLYQWEIPFLGAGVLSYCDLQNGYVVCNSKTTMHFLNIYTGKVQNFNLATESAPRIRDSLCLVSEAAFELSESEHKKIFIMDLTTGKTLRTIDQEAFCHHDPFWFDHGLTIRVSGGDHSLRVLDFRSENQKQK